MKQQQGSKSTKIETVKSGTPAKTIKEVVKSGSPDKAKREVPEKKRSPFFKIEKHELSIMENGFENRNSKEFLNKYFFKIILLTLKSMILLYRIY